MVANSKHGSRLMLFPSHQFNWLAREICLQVNRRACGAEDLLVFRVQIVNAWRGPGDPPDSICIAKSEVVIRRKVDAAIN